MAGRKRFSVLRDPVHGDVHLTHEELAVLDTPEMQRLRGVKQLGSAYLVYPGARHRASSTRSAPRTWRSA